MRVRSFMTSHKAVLTYIAVMVTLGFLLQLREWIHHG